MKLTKRKLMRLITGTKCPWIGVKGAFKDQRWKEAKPIAWKYLEYEPLVLPKATADIYEACRVARLEDGN